ncbi:hypothetical protein QFC20_007096 [Naganishia adeliensis]|uniref:Uncharacterized protein n=1 Tax=Naganishia adeliensis TaxID=92952 RepID=A0ACC2V428_9TREE|nr:hypothetical protein QFC20_007096 [Naganishia adeliensis]
MSRFGITWPSRGGYYAADHKKHGQPGTGGWRTMDKKRRNKMIASYLADWVLTIFLWAIFYLLDKINGYRRLFSITDESLAHPYAEHERIPVWALALIAGVFPLIVILLTAAFYTRSFYDAQVGALGLGLSLGLTVTLTDIIKITVGRPRPDLFGRCEPPLDYTENPIHGLTSWRICTRTDLLNDGFRSFPSGHSSFGWCGMVYLALFLAGKMHVLNKRGYTIKSWILLIPVATASLISISRTMDYRHHATDVIAGGIIGILIAWYAYRQYYPCLSAENCHRPYSPRIAHEDAHITAEEGPDFVPVDGVPVKGGPILPTTTTASSALSNGGAAYMRTTQPAYTHTTDPRPSIGDDMHGSRDGPSYTTAASPLIPAAAPHANHHYPSNSGQGYAGYPPVGTGPGGLADTVDVPLRDAQGHGQERSRFV